MELFCLHYKDRLVTVKERQIEMSRDFPKVSVSAVAPIADIEIPSLREEIEGWNFDSLQCEEVVLTIFVARNEMTLGGEIRQGQGRQDVSFFRSPTRQGKNVEDVDGNIHCNLLNRNDIRVRSYKNEVARHPEFKSQWIEQNREVLDRLVQELDKKAADVLEDQRIASEAAEKAKRERWAKESQQRVLRQERKPIKKNKG
jgi:hypothetical protein